MTAPLVRTVIVPAEVRTAIVRAEVRTTVVANDE